MTRLLLLVAVWSLSLAGSGRAFADADTPSALDPLGRWLQGELRVGLGVDYSRGDYGEDKATEMVYAPFSLAYVFDDFAPTPTPRDQLELRAIVPFVYVDGVLTSGVSGTERESGLGDILLGAAYLYYPRTSWLPASEWGVQVKVPTASERHRLGTGETDVSLEATLFQRIGDFVPYGSGGYRFIGQDTNAYDLRNGAVASAGVSWIPSPGWSLGVGYDWRQSISKRAGSDGLVRADDGHELSFFGSAAMSSGVVGDLRLSPYAVAGLSNGSPDYAFGFQIQIALPVRPPSGD